MNNNIPSTQQTTSSKRLALRGALGAGIGAVTLASMLALTGGTAGAIVDGSPTTASTHPWQVSLQDGPGGHFCGGSIVNATTIVTAAHCVEGMSAADVTIRAGITKTDDSGQDRDVASVTSHPDYAAAEVGDIAVIKLAQPLTLNGNVQAIQTATAAELANATAATVTGWGDTSEQGGTPEQLLEAQVPLVSDAICAAQLGTDALREVCAAGEGRDSCYGDSGGPLTITTADGPKLAGVVSWGEECAGPTPGVYAEVPFYENFIQTGAAEVTVEANNNGSANAEGDFQADDFDGTDFDEFDFDETEFDDADFEDGAYDWGDSDFEDDAFDWDDGEWVYEVEVDGEWVEMTEAELDAFLDSEGDFSDDWEDSDWDFEDDALFDEHYDDFESDQDWYDASEDLNDDFSEDDFYDFDGFQDDCEEGEHELAA